MATCMSPSMASVSSRYSPCSAISIPKSTTQILKLLTEMPNLPHKCQKVTARMGTCMSPSIASVSSRYSPWSAISIPSGTWERESVCVCVREGGDRERGCVCVRERGGRVCVCERERGGERDGERVCVRARGRREREIAAPSSGDTFDSIQFESLFVHSN